MLKHNDNSQLSVLDFGACLFSHDYSLACCCRMAPGSEVFQKMTGEKNIHTALDVGSSCVEPMGLMHAKQ